MLNEPKQRQSAGVWFWGLIAAVVIVVALHAQLSASSSGGGGSNYTPTSTPATACVPCLANPIGSDGLPVGP